MAHHHTPRVPLGAGPGVGPVAQALADGAGSVDDHPVVAVAIKAAPNRNIIMTGTRTVSSAAHGVMATCTTSRRMRTPSARLPNTMNRCVTPRRRLSNFVRPSPWVSRVDAIHVGRSSVLFP